MFPSSARRPCLLGQNDRNEVPPARVVIRNIPSRTRSAKKKLIICTFARGLDDDVLQEPERVTFG